MERQIIIKKCGKCPYCASKHGGLYCQKIAEVHQNEVGFDDIHKDCPLVEIADRVAPIGKDPANIDKDFCHYCTNLFSEGVEFMSKEQIYQSIKRKVFEYNNWQPQKQPAEAECQRCEHKDKPFNERPCIGCKKEASNGLS